jgi:hypothetical protein
LYLVSLLTFPSIFPLLSLLLWPKKKKSTVHPWLNLVWCFL